MTVLNKKVKKLYIPQNMRLNDDLELIKHKLFVFYMIRQATFTASGNPVQSV